MTLHDVFELITAKITATKPMTDHKNRDNLIINFKLWVYPIYCVHVC